MLNNLKNVILIFSFNLFEILLSIGSFLAELHNVSRKKIVSCNHV